jgi:hypothetical protein
MTRASVLECASPLALLDRSRDGRREKSARGFSSLAEKSRAKHPSSAPVHKQAAESLILEGLQTVAGGRFGLLAKRPPETGP